jgi:hypothetical protein
MSTFRFRALLITPLFAVAALAACSSDTTESSTTSVTTTSGSGGANVGGAGGANTGGQGAGGANTGGQGTGGQATGGAHAGGSGGANAGGNGEGGGINDLCLNTGGTPTEGMCCKGAGPNPNSCGVGSCGCSADESEVTPLCSCPQGQCYDPNAGCVPDGGQGGGGGAPPTSKCVQTGGTESTGECCKGTPDFPDMCAAGPCGCSPQNSATVKVCDCPQGQCYDMTNGCVPLK